MTAALITSIILVIGLLIALVLITALFLRALNDAFQLTDRVSSRNQKHVDQLINRIMAADWRAWREAYSEDAADEGGQILPTDNEDLVGFQTMELLSDEELRALSQERTLLQEDFPDENR
jgi:hypothetical protein